MFNRTKERNKHLNKNLAAFLGHQTPTKLLNFMRVESQRILRRSVLTGLPYVLSLDITNACNLKCPFCPTGVGRPSGRGKGFMSVPLFKDIIDTVKDYCYIVNLFDWGEPLLHREICEMIRYAHDSNIYTAMSSNFNLPLDEAGAERLVASGLQYLYTGLDGASQETYSQYRVGGQFERSITNLQTLMNARRRLKSETPIVEWRFLVFRHNEHEIEKARQMAADLGINRIVFEGGILEDMSERTPEGNLKWLSTIPKYQRTYKNEESRCNWLWRNLTVNWDGTIAPCCWAYKAEHDFGEFNKATFRDTWNNMKFAASRGLFKDRQERTAGTFCDGCIKVAKWRESAAMEKN